MVIFFLLLVFNLNSFLLSSFKAAAGHADGTGRGRRCNRHQHPQPSPGTDRSQIIISGYDQYHDLGARLIARSRSEKR